VLLHPTRNPFFLFLALLRLQDKAPASAITPKKEEKNFAWDPTTPSKEELI
jgi:hypothetical protein